MTVNYKLTEIEGEAFLTLFSPDGTVICATPDTHSNFELLVDLAVTGDESIYEEAEVGKALQRKFDDVVNGRVAIRNGVVYFDDDPMDNAITGAIVRFHEQGEDFTPLVKFFENVMANPQVESREQFYRWIENHEFPIDDEGNIVAYKSVDSAGDGVYRSISSGHAFVNGIEVNGRVHQRIGDVVTMPRSEVEFDPKVACHVGLHAGTWEYASWFAGNTIMFVRINPRDVVSVPNDERSQKVRVCRYEVVDFAENKYDGARFATAEDEAAPLDEEPAERPFAGKSKVVKVGDRIRLKAGHYPDRSLLDLGLKRVDSLKGVYEVIESPSGVHVSDESFHALIEGKAIGLWDTEVAEVNPDEDGKWDTRLNYTKQKRGPGGRFVKSS